MSKRVVRLTERVQDSNNLWLVLILICIICPIHLNQITKDLFDLKDEISN